MKRNEIVDYEHGDETLPMLVTHVNDQENGDGSVIGTVFRTDGTAFPVTFIPEESAPEEPESTPETLTDEEAAQLQAMLDARKSGQTTPEPAPAPADPTGGTSTLGQHTQGVGDVPGQTVGGPATGSTPATQDPAGNNGGNQ